MDFSGTTISVWSHCVQMLTFFKKQQISHIRHVFDIYTFIFRQTGMVLGKEIYIGDFAVRSKWAAVPVYTL